MNEIIKALEGMVLGTSELPNRKLVLKVSNNNLREIVNYLLKLGGIYTVTIGGESPLDNMSHYVIHVFSFDELKIYVLLKVELSNNDVVTSITPLIKGADWGEREVRDLLGIEFVGHPDPRKLVLPDDWPQGLHPLKKDFNYRLRPEVSSEPYRLERPDGLVALPYGPYHPMLHEPEYFELHVMGETVVGVEYRGFHVHRGIEKLAESRLTYNQVPFVSERICGICGFVHSVCYCQAVEEAASIEVPERALYIRSLLLEIERIHSHLLWVGVACHVLGFDTGFMHTWRIREHVMHLAELITGSRKTYGVNLVGGVRRDVREDQLVKVIKVLRDVSNEFRKFANHFINLREMVKRLEGSGVLPKHEALSYGVVGPVARGSGLKRDVRIDHPYAAYEDVSFNVPVYSEGDNMARFMVRVEEVFESVSIVEHLIDKLPKGPIIAEDVEIPEFKEGFSAVEAPRGEDVHYVMTGRYSKLHRWRVRAPSYMNIPALKIMLYGCPLSDAPLTVASIDPCFSCTDRLVIVDLKSGRKFRVPMRALSKGWSP